MRHCHTIIMVVEKNFRWKKGHVPFSWTLTFIYLTKRRIKNEGASEKKPHSCIALITDNHCISHCKQWHFKTHRDSVLQTDSQISLYNKCQSLLNVFYQPSVDLIQSPGKSLKPVGLVLKSKAKNRVLHQEIWLFRASVTQLSFLTEKRAFKRTVFFKRAFERTVFF